MARKRPASRTRAALGYGRSKRTIKVRERTESAREVRALAAALRADNDAVDRELVALGIDPRARPRTRGECRDGERPCPFVSCRYHLAIEVSPTTGLLTLNFPDREVWELEHTCALDGADEGGMSLEALGQRLNLVRERIRQLEIRAISHLQAAVQEL